jgi:hypothetical protein
LLSHKLEVESTFNLSLLLTVDVVFTQY